jgi:glycosyltransferase involved in cell wall biosynthesis
MSKRVAIVHDWLYGGGAEKVVYELHKLYPEAPIYTSYCSDEWRTKLDDVVITGWLQHWPFNKLRKYIPFLRIWWFTHLDLSKYDLVLSSSGAEAKGIKVRPAPLHINYCHAPTHYYWSRYDEYLAHPGFGVFDPLARFGLKLLVAPLRKWDYKAAQRPDYLIANSTHIQSEIKKYYGRSSTVIFPPVDTARFTAQSPARPLRSGFIIAGRQTPYKRTDLAIEACSRLNLPLMVIGNGPDHSRLVVLAGDTITFASANDTELVAYFQSAAGFIFPGLDDFGIVAIEALAAGTPLIAYGAGGAIDYVTTETGVSFKPQTVEALIHAIQDFQSKQFDHEKIALFSNQFSVSHFSSHMVDFIASCTAEKAANKDV